MPAPAQLSLCGDVIDSSGKKVAGASVSLTSRDPESFMKTTTDASGTFFFDSLPKGSYILEAEQRGAHAAPVAGNVPSASGDVVELVLGASQAAADGHTESGSADKSPAFDKGIDFADKPDFVVSGVTDWTAVGGHGSDSTLRTSENLAQRTLDAAVPLENQATPEGQRTDEDKHMEARLAASVAAAPRDFQANHALGMYYLDHRRFREALSPLQAAFEAGGQQPQDAYCLALALSGSGLYGKARQRVASAMGGKNSAAFELLAGQLDEKLGDPLSAVKEFRRATELSATEENYLAWGSELLLHRAVWQAAEVFEKGTGAFPRSLALKTALGTALFSGALYEQAAQQLCEASDLAPSDVETYKIMGQVELASPSALPCIEQKLARFATIDAEDADANFLYAMSLLKADPASNRKRAEDLLTTASRLNPHSAAAFLQLGIMALEQHKYPEAVDLLKKAVALDPKQAEPHYRLAAAYLRTGKGDEAQQELHLHDEIEKARAEEVEQQRRAIKQFLVTMQSQPALASQR